MTDTGCIAEVELPAESVFFAETLSAMPELVVEVSLTGRVTDTATSYLYVRGSEHEAFTERAASDPTVSTVERLDTVTQGGLYYVDWTLPEDSVLGVLPDEEMTILRAMGHGDTARWEATLHFGSRSEYGTFTTAAIRNRLDWQLTQTYWPDPLPEIGH